MWTINGRFISCNVKKIYLMFFFLNLSEKKIYIYIFSFCRPRYLLDKKPVKFIQVKTENDVFKVRRYAPKTTVRSTNSCFAEAKLTKSSMV